MYLYIYISRRVQSETKSVTPKSVVVHLDPPP